MIKTSRYILVIMTIMVTSIALPQLYWMIREEPVRPFHVQYSYILNDFTIFDNKKNIRTDPKGNCYTQDEYETLHPLTYTRHLVINKCMPDSICGVEVNLSRFAQAHSFTKIFSKDFQLPGSKLYPLMESVPLYANIKLPEDVFRIDWRVEFINCNTNEVNEEKSQLYSAALYHKGFVFPAVKVAGIPKVRKLYDEGYIVVDSEEQLFHFKMIQSQPYIRRIEVPEGLCFKHISCVAFADKRYYAYLISEDNGIYVLTQDDYKLIRWPIDDYAPEQDQIRILGNYFNYNITLQSDNRSKTYALSRDYKLIDSYEYTKKSKRQKIEGIISASIFPFELSLNSRYSRYIKFYPILPQGIVWIFVNLLFVGLQFYFIVRRKCLVKEQLLDLVLIALTGLFGIIAVNIFPNRQMKKLKIKR